ncbi:hypothetical protein GUITHDRAFT_134704 [Guillardia theta CCMP2712]|uniref:Uncharacterized protein n=1 Tax=Guillardia theta (strain CCMP2712) TaxID=905079 RepID=L1JSN2_GUITC|nr:hypothetical protein GUITHDRAFT_134704 [Guillardia theta CCMP2712]EKX51200.1 hypothetical protein GUITHDRAFT_134704 [Guillardia theta CCMP2712]|eukprot:XP_005838180.1 hypothetical protein GUITHDRAFT_134704 [Guillardia theta CCMP2712]
MKHVARQEAKNMSPTKLPRPKKLFHDAEEADMEFALVDHQLHSLIDEGALCLADENVKLHHYVQPASIDLPVSGTAYLVKEKILPFKKRVECSMLRSTCDTCRMQVKDLIGELTLEEKSLTGKGAVLLKGQSYLIYCGVICLQKGQRGCLSPKSSIGRVDIMVRGIVDGCGLYDVVPGDGISRELWLEISPRSFNIRVHAGIAMTQLMIFAACNEDDAFQTPIKSVYDDFDHSPAKSVTLHSEEGGEMCKEMCNLREDFQSFASIEDGFEALPTEDILDLSLTDFHHPRKFFREIFPSDQGRLTLEKDRFYILATKERVCVPTYLSAEMVPFSHHVGELRAHYAGFFDPGFGYGREGEVKGTVGVLEIRVGTKEAHLSDHVPDMF